MRKCFYLLAAVVLATLSCSQSNPTDSVPPLNASDISGSWRTVKIHEYGFLDTNGVRETWDTTYRVEVEHPMADMWKFENALATRYTKEGEDCFYKYDPIPFALSGYNIVGEFWSGAEEEDGGLYKWSNSIRESPTGLTLTYVEDESYHDPERSDTSHEVWEYSLEPPPSGITLDSLAATLANCPLLKRGDPANKPDIW